MVEGFQNISLEESAKTYETKLRDAYNEIGKSHLCAIQKKAYLCAADCCDKKSGSFEAVQDCAENCTRSLQVAQHYLKNEFEDFQARLTRCLSSCNDKVKDTMELEKATDFNDKHKAVFEQCGHSCFTRFTQQLPSILFKVRDNLEKHHKI